MAPSRMTTKSTHPDAEESSQEARPDLDQKLDQMLTALAEANRKAEMAHATFLGLKDEVVEVRRDNARLEELLASKARSGRREDFDEEVQQESGGQSPKEVPASSKSRMQGSDKVRQGLSELERYWTEDTKKAQKMCFPTGNKKSW
ncbi:hypothetical protein PanWU01x14_180450 [Parasponia andersonii]|uniref:Uncharacterized protein n=1 Tax=Parasponia andersonii TaxID=3476 RepID=A0A2P5C6C6_PARAD|nr:hypothetical protein PanWU01x14_180450 [Parasponia andersonii]